MRTHLFMNWAALAILAGCAGAVLVSRHAQNRELRGELASLRTTFRAAASARAAEPKPLGKIDDSDSDEVAVVRLREQIAALKARAAERKRGTSVDVPVAERPRPRITETELPFEAWRNAGNRTPVDALETILWASASGNVDALAELFSIDPVVRTRVNAMLLHLPDAIRRDYGTPERLIALLTAPDVPLGSAKIFDPKFQDAKGVRLATVLQMEGKPPHAANVTFRQESDGWKLVVPMAVVEKYAATFTARQ